MKHVVVIGAGKIGTTIAGLLASTGDHQVTLADRSSEALARLRLRPTSRVECPVHSRRLRLAHRRTATTVNRGLLAKSVHTPPLGISPLKALTVSIRVVPE